MLELIFWEIFVFALLWTEEKMVREKRKRFSTEKRFSFSPIMGILYAYILDTWYVVFRKN